MSTFAITTWVASAFGLTVRSDVPWPGATPAAGNEVDVDVDVRRVDSDALDAAWSGHAGGHDWPLLIDDAILRVQRGVDGDFLLLHDDRARFHVDAAGAQVLCEPRSGAPRAWERVLLDTVMWTTALIHGREALHASAVATPAGVVGLLGVMGGGKTTLACELLGRGHRLMCDDVLVVERAADGILAHPGPPVANVPTGHPVLRSLPAADRLAEFDDEAWVVVPTCAKPLPLAGLLMLERAPGVANEIVPVAATGLDLRRFALTHGQLPGRERARFELFSDVADRVPVARLRADIATSPASLANLVEAWAQSTTGTGDHP
jgi:hypothetical protein